MGINRVIEKIDEALDDYSMPKRIKVILSQVREDLRGKTDQLDVVITSSIYTLDEATNDVNISMHAKTALWDIISDLEALKK
jgi:uncharacterized protein